MLTERQILRAGLMMTLACSMSLACTLGPRVRTEVVLVTPGRPLQVTQNVTVKGQILGTDQPVKQDIGGWIAMPRDHFDALMRAASP